MGARDLRDYTDLVEPLSLDKFLGDATDSETPRAGLEAPPQMNMRARKALSWASQSRRSVLGTKISNFLFLRERVKSGAGTSSPSERPGMHLRKPGSTIRPDASPCSRRRTTVTRSGRCRQQNLLRRGPCDERNGLRGIHHRRHLCGTAVDAPWFPSASGAPHPPRFRNGL